MNASGRIAALAAALVLLAGAPPVRPQGDAAQPAAEHRVEYVVKSVDYDLKLGFGSGKSDAADVAMNVHTAAVHNHPDGILFLVVYLTGRDANGKDLPLNAAALLPAEKRAAMPMSARLDGAVAVIWFDEPWPRASKREFSLKAKTNIAAMKGLRTIVYLTYGRGTKPEDGLRYLGDPVLSEKARRDFAARLSERTGKLHRYLDDAGTWVHPPCALVATDEEQVSDEFARDTGPSETGKTEVKLQNHFDRKLSIRLGGGGKTSWVSLEAKTGGVIELEPGLWALTAYERNYVTRVVLLKAERTYVVRFGP